MHEEASKDEVMPMPSSVDGGAMHQSQQPQEDKPTEDSGTMSVKEMFALRRRKEREKFVNVPSKYKGFESLLVTEDDEFDDSPPLPAGKSHDQ